MKTRYCIRCKTPLDSMYDEGNVAHVICFTCELDEEYSIPQVEPLTEEEVEEICRNSQYNQF